MDTLNQTEKKGFQGLTVAAFESRMAKEMEDLITRHGGKARVAPSMREIPLAENKEVFGFFDQHQHKKFDVMIFLTGVGTRALFQALETKFPKSHVVNAFKMMTLLARGPKSVKALADYGLKPTLTAPEPNTWREVLSTLENRHPVEGQRIAVQEYGVSNTELLDKLLEMGAKEVVSVPVYRWDLPEDTKPLVALIESILQDEVQVALFTSATQIHNVFHVAKGLGMEQQLKNAFNGMVVGSIGPIATETLKEYGLTVDFEPEHSKMGFLVKEIAEKSPELLQGKNTGRVKLAAPPPIPANQAALLHNSLFMKACRKEATPRPPIWIMRQAGRYMPEYQKIRSTVSFLTLCKRPDLAAEVTVTAQQVLGVDAAILFADILLISEPLGFHLDFAENHGPVINDPFRESADLKRLKEVNAAADLGYVMEAIRLIRSQLKPNIPLIGFAGAPFTLASYLIEGGGSKDYFNVRKLLAEDFSVWDEFMKRIVAATISYLNAQINAGAQVLQLFDSWVGILAPDEFKRYALPYIKLLISGLKPGVPIIYFGTETAPFYPFLKETGANVIGVDWRMDLDEAWKQLGNVAIQGNLDPQVLLTDPKTIREKAEAILKKAAGRPGHIFNLGHGILPSTPMENAHALVDFVKSWKS